MKTASPGVRGCGYARAGFYVIGAAGPGGTLAPVTITAGSHVVGEPNNLHCELDPMLMHWIDPERTVDTCQLHFLESSRHDRAIGDYVGSPRQQIHNLGPYAVAHHVGATYYTPLQHMLETATMGPSLRIDKRVAIQIAPYLPMRVFFHFSELPYFQSISHRTAFRDEVVFSETRDAIWAEAAQTLRIPVVTSKTSAQIIGYDWDRDSFGPTWENPKWGGTIFDDNGLGDSIVKVVSYIERNDDWPHDVARYPGILYYSWITRAVQYVDHETVQKRYGESLTPQDIDNLDGWEFLDPDVRDAGVRIEPLVLMGEAG